MRKTNDHSNDLSLGGAPSQVHLVLMVLMATPSQVWGTCITLFLADSMRVNGYGTGVEGRKDRPWACGVGDGEGDKSSEKQRARVKDNFYWQKILGRIWGFRNLHQSLPVCPTQFSNSLPCQSSSPGVWLEFVLKLNFLQDLPSQFWGLTAMAKGSLAPS